MSAENWMSELPANCIDKPLTQLAIPGSHNSATSQLQIQEPIGFDQPAYVQALSGQSLVHKAVYNWSRDQCLSLVDQLKIGVRYFDMRVAMYKNEMRLVHGLYCQDLPSAFVDILQFLGDHPKEILLIDLNHFYKFTLDDHKNLLQMIISLFDSKLCSRPRLALSTITLRKLWETGKQTIIFYQPADDAMHLLPMDVWTRNEIVSPWPRTEDYREMIKQVNEIIATRDNTMSQFQVCQAIVTLDSRSVMRQPMASFENEYARQATRSIVEWLRINGRQHRDRINVILCDFVDESEFCRAVIDLNRLEDDETLS